jgi:hypothetical protein
MSFRVEYIRGPHLADAERLPGRGIRIEGRGTTWTSET